MNLEAWGDEGNVATNWEDTAMREDLDKVLARFKKWFSDYASEMPNDEAKAACGAVDDAFKTLIDGHMTGRIDA